MKVNNYINIHSNNFLTGPYFDGCSNIGKSFSGDAKKIVVNASRGEVETVSLTLADRAQHLLVGLALLIPVVNVTFYYALRFFATTDFSPVTMPETIHSPSTTHPSIGGVHGRTGHTGAGVLPYSICNGEVYFLLSKEGYGSAANTWCDFGGAKDPGEVAVRTASRECWEESRDILGNQASIESRLLASPAIGNRYNIFLMKVDQPTPITNQNFLSRVFTDFCRMEKTKIAWVKASEVFDAAVRNQPLRIDGANETLRGFFATTLRDALRTPAQKRSIDQIFRDAGQTLLQSA